MDKFRSKPIGSPSLPPIVDQQRQIVALILVATFKNRKMNCSDLALRTRSLGYSAVFKFKPGNQIVHLYALHCTMCFARGLFSAD
jgi:hypothetical protein